MKNIIIGIDIGGTSIKLGLISAEGEIIHKWSIETRTINNGKHIIDDIWQTITDTLGVFHLNEADLLGIGAGIPGFIDSKSGIVYEAINIGWKDLHFKEQFEKRTDVPVIIENDANAAALGENWKGAGSQAKHLIAVTLGTGVGGGIITNGAILSGQNGMAGELGHILVEEGGALCNCGKQGCLETIASATGIVRQAVEKIADYPDSLIALQYKKAGHITAEDIFQLAAEGDALANWIIARTGDMLGGVFANLGAVLNPEKILIGGGVSKAGPAFISKIKDSFEKKALPRVAEACQIERAQLENDAGIIGAAYLVKQYVETISI